MSIAWYPWQLFIRKWEVTVPVAFALAIVVIISIWLEYALSRVPQPVFLHYSSELGVDALGSPHRALFLPGTLLLVVLVNAIIGNIFMLSSKTVSRLALWTPVPLALLALWFSMLILRVNGA